MTVRELLEKIRNDPECEVLPPAGIPECAENCRLPDDIREFYGLCGGVVLFPSSEYHFEIAAPGEFQLANPVIVGELCPEDISSQWYIVACNLEEDYLTVDLSEKRNGRCYDSFWDRHGVAGECPVIAKSFTELLSRLYENRGGCLYWLEDDFASLGDAYDE